MLDLETDGLLVLVSVECGLANGYELSKEPRRILEQLADMRPDRSLELWRFHWSA